MKWEQVGEIGIVAGICWLGDPCYILDERSGKRPKDIGKDWMDFCGRIGDDDVVQFKYDEGHAGLGVCVRTGYGDGFYPVEVKRNTEGRIAEVRVKFI